MIYRFLPSGMAAYRLKLQYLLCTFILAIVSGVKGFTLAGSPITEDPFLLSKQIIRAHREHCGTHICNRIPKTCIPWEVVERQDPAYLLYESPGLTPDLPGRDAGVVEEHNSLENAKVSIQKALNESNKFWGMPEQEQTGLVTYESYLRFNEIREPLQRSLLARLSTYKSSIKISEPGRNTVWVLNEPVALQWSTSNIPADKSLRFFLVKGEMVVQELGTFKNSGAAKGIRLNKNIDSGDDYRVVGIELFPENTNNIAKMATPFFSIRRPERRKKAAVNSPATTTVATNAPATERMSFEGRNITYVKELTVNNKEIRISIWDHGRQDRDIVSIYLNGEPVVSRHSLTYRKKHFELVLDTARKNDLFLYAHNLGIYPPNTVSIEIVDGDSSESIILNSDLKSCEAMLINVKQ
jgi:hypothetical protein